MAKAKADDFTDDVWAMMRALKARVVVALRVVGEADFPPRCFEARDGPGAGDLGGEPGAARVGAMAHGLPWGKPCAKQF